MKDLRWSAVAEADLAAIDDYLWAEDPRWAEEATALIEAAAQFLREVPEAGPPIGSPASRKWTVRVTGHILIYRVLDEAVEILRVRHVREDWRPR